MFRMLLAITGYHVLLYTTEYAETVVPNVSDVVTSQKSKRACE
jgi:hypothetical protein